MDPRHEKENREIEGEKEKTREKMRERKKTAQRGDKNS